MSAVNKLSEKFEKWEKERVEKEAERKAEESRPADALEEHDDEGFTRPKDMLTPILEEDSNARFVPRQEVITRGKGKSRSMVVDDNDNNGFLAWKAKLQDREEVGESKGHQQEMGEGESRLLKHWAVVTQGRRMPAVTGQRRMLVVMWKRAMWTMLREIQEKQQQSSATHKARPNWRARCPLLAS